MKNKALWAAIFGILLGLVSNYQQFITGWLNLIPWGIAGIIIGFLIKDKRQALKAGAWYGFFLCLSYLLSGYKGTHAIHQLAGFAVVALVISLVGCVCGMGLTYIGNLFVKKSVE